MTLSPRPPSRLLRQLAIACAVLCGLVIPSSPQASHISSPWEDYVLRADFVGIVECTTAGGIVARYRVIESWKGPAAGTEMTIRSETSSSGDHFPITLAGEKFLIVARRTRRPLIEEKPRSRGSEPMWWSPLPYEYEFLGSSGRVLLPVDREEGLWEICSEHRDVDSFRLAARILIDLTPDQQEAYFLREASSASFWDRRGHLIPSPPKDLSAQAEVQRLLREARSGSEEDLDEAMGTLSYAGGPVALRILEGMTPKESPFDAEELASIIRWIREHTGEGEDSPDSTDVNEDDSRPSEGALSQARSTMASAGTDKAREYNVSNAIDLLTVHDPGTVIPYLLHWDAPERSLDPVGVGYVLGSYFGFRCGSERAEHLKALMGADHPIIRVAAAVYLALEDEEQGLPVLRGHLGQPDDSGAWAAVSLISHGERSAIPRALELLRPSEAPRTQGNFHEVLRGRLLVLLSNIAHESRVPPPPSPRKLLKAEWIAEDRESVETRARKLYQEYLQWFDAYHDSLMLQPLKYQNRKSRGGD